MERSSDYNNFHLFDPEPILCPGDQEYCERIVDGVVAYIDTNHLSISGARLLLEPFTNFLIENKIID